MAVSVPIAQFSDAARAAGLAVYETGLSHGTVTIGADNHQVEVTQLRTDHDTDGRHARIEPTQSWEEDAQRRDFTINALYLDADGRVHDPQGGLADIASSQLRFIGRAEERLAEDYLRLLRGLRLRAQYPGLWMDAKIQPPWQRQLADYPACQQNVLLQNYAKYVKGQTRLP